MTTATPDREECIRLRAIKLAQAEAYSKVVQSLREEAAYLAKRAGLTQKQEKDKLTA